MDTGVDQQSQHCRGNPLIRRRSLLKAELGKLMDVTHNQANITVFGHQALLWRNFKSVDRASKLQEGSAVKY